MIPVREVRTDVEWEQACAVMHDVYIGEGFTAADVVRQVQTRDNMEGAGVLLVAMGANDVVTGVVLFLHPGSKLQQLARPGEREFRMLAVSARIRGGGTGEALVRACVDRATAEGAAALVLWTQPTMHAAQRLYARLGFVRDPSRDVPDARGWDRLVYVRSLP